MRRKITLLLVGVCLILGLAPRSMAVVEGLPQVEIHVNPLVEMIAQARIDCREDDAPIVDQRSPEWASVLRSTKALEAAGVRSPGWSAVICAAAESASAAEFEEKCRSLPVSMPTSEGGAIYLREEASRLATAMAASEPAWMRDQWPSRKRALDQAAASVQQTLIADDAWLAYVLQTLNMSQPQEVVPVYLVTCDAVPGGPAAITYRTRAGGACFVSINMPVGGDDALWETIIHEVIHALDISTLDEQTALQILRKAIADAKIPPSDPRVRNLPHLLIFVHAAETVRRKINPMHKDYGDVSGLYKRLGADSMTVQAVWRSVLDGSIDMHQAAARIVDESLKRDPVDKNSPQSPVD